MPHALSREELEEFTGADTPLTQKNVLKKYGIRFIERRDGSPATTWEAVNHALIGDSVQHSGNEPNWDAVDAA